MSLYLHTAWGPVGPCIVNSDYEAFGLGAVLFRLHCITILIVWYLAGYVCNCLVFQYFSMEIPFRASFFVFLIQAGALESWTMERKGIGLPILESACCGSPGKEWPDVWRTSWSRRLMLSEAALRSSWTGFHELWPLRNQEARPLAGKGWDRKVYTYHDWFMEGAFKSEWQLNCMSLREFSVGVVFLCMFILVLWAFILFDMLSRSCICFVISCMGPRVDEFTPNLITRE